MKKKSALSLILAIGMALGMVLSATACGGTGLRSDISYLYVFNYDGGVGREWLDNIAAKFQEEYADYSFEEGKKGVIVEVTPGESNLSTLGTDKYNVIFTEQVLYNDFISQGLLLDISDVVDGSFSATSGITDSRTIEEKMSQTQRDAITAMDGKYYVIPHYEVYTGLTYDVDLFYKNVLFFKDGGGWTDIDAEKSVGPDGVRGTSDDGLPSSYEEFYKLMDRMVNVAMVVPFIWTGEFTNYTNDLLAGLWAACAGKNEFELNVNFDSSKTGTQATVINRFDEKGNPVEEKIDVTPETGYMMSHQASKYYAYAFLEKLLSSSSYYSTEITEVLSHLGAQEEFIYSSLENDTPIAMLIDGSYWYNEAKDIFRRSENTYKEKAKDRNFAWMPLPTQYSGSVKEGEGKKNALLEILSSYSFINANIKDKPEIVKMAKMFLQYCYTEEALVDFSVTTGIPKALNYTVPEEKLAQLPRYQQSLFKVKAESDIIYPYSDNKIFMVGQANFKFDQGSLIWGSTVNGTPYLNAYYAMNRGVSAKDYFMGAWTTENDWNDAYSVYFNAK